MTRIALIVCLLSFTASSARAQTQPRPIAVDDLFRFERVADSQISPDGKHVVYVQTKVDLAGNKSSANLWLADTADGTRRQLTSTPKSDRHPRWSPDGKHILFHSNRSGSNQLWVIGIDGGEARQLTTLSTETGLWSRDGKRIAFVSAVYPEFSDKPFKESDKLNKQKIDEIAKSPVKAKIFTRLFYRHWDDYVEDKRQHLFVVPFDGEKAGEPRDVTPGDYDAYPTSTTFSVGDDFTFSPDGSHLVFTAVPKTNEAWSTNYDIWRVSVNGGKPENLTAANKAADGAPQFSPDGKQLAYRAQKRPGFEADRWELMLVECEPDGRLKGTPRSVTAKFDSWVEEFAWAPDGHAIFFTADERGRVPVWYVNLKSGAIYLALGGFATEGAHAALSINKTGPTMVAYTHNTMRRPNEVFVSSEKDGLKNLSHANDKLLAELDMPAPENYLVRGAAGTPMQMWVLKPPGFDPKKRWPLVYLVHGGPQGAWHDGWSYRWNPEVWAARGYVVALPNPRGSTGFGQQYVDEISGDWGGKCYDDLMKGVEFLEKQPWIDKDRMAAAGASFGGYMMNWFQGNTTKFKTLITHCGVYNFESMYALTDELWFDEWEHGGPPWGKNRAAYEKHSPHRRAAHFKTPMLIIHNDLDFRVPVAEGQQLFTTLQRLGIPSRFVNFPDEGHWVLRPQNSRYWNREVFDWLKKYAPPGGK
jgi:dipeptidyl aminopeptidase/acylaminoacyl peptidase